MSYRIRYEAKQSIVGKWLAAGMCVGMILWAAAGLGPVWSRMAAGEGLYEALGRFIGGMIRGAG